MGMFYKYFGRPLAERFIIIENTDHVQLPLNFGYGETPQPTVLAAGYQYINHKAQESICVRLLSGRAKDNQRVGRNLDLFVKFSS